MTKLSFQVERIFDPGKLKTKSKTLPLIPLITLIYADEESARVSHDEDMYEEENARSLTGVRDDFLDGIFVLYQDTASGTALIQL